MEASQPLQPNAHGGMVSNQEMAILGEVLERSTLRSGAGMYAPHPAPIYFIYMCILVQ